LTKKYTNPSSDIITVLAGLDEVDQVISGFVAVLDGIIRNGKTCEKPFNFVESRAYFFLILQQPRFDSWPSKLLLQ
jgi:hypothetical protein